MESRLITNMDVVVREARVNDDSGCRNKDGSTCIGLDNEFLIPGSNNLCWVVVLRMAELIDPEADGSSMSFLLKRELDNFGLDMRRIIDDGKNNNRIGPNQCLSCVKGLDGYGKREVVREANGFNRKLAIVAKQLNDNFGREVLSLQKSKRKDQIDTTEE